MTNEITKRDFFGGGKKEKEPKTVTVIELAGLGKVRLISSAHTIPNSLRELGNANALAIETGTWANVYPSVSTVEGKTSLADETALHTRWTLDSRQYEKLIESMRANGAPVFFSDVFIAKNLLSALSRRSGPEKGIFSRRNAVRAVVGGGAVASFLVSKSSMDLLDQKIPHPHASLIEEPIKTFAAGLFSITAVQKFIEHQSRKRNSLGIFLRSQYSFGSDMKQNIILKFRDLVMAEKITVALQVCREYGIHDPVLAAPVGAAHVDGMLEALKLSSAERTAFMHQLLDTVRSVRTKDGGEKAATAILEAAMLLPAVRWDKTKKDWSVIYHKIVDDPSDKAG
ncbi:MAG TPA: hypothetical protein VI957_02220 [Candidatus Paceibacterota bacterium]